MYEDTNNKRDGPCARNHEGLSSEKEDDLDERGRRNNTVKIDTVNGDA